MTPGESEELRATLGDFFRDDGLALEATGRPGEWLATGELLRALPCASLDRLLEPGVDAALLGNSPDPAARTLRRLQQARTRWRPGSPASGRPASTPY